MFVCPNRQLTVSIGIPCESVMVVAKVCRAMWKVSLFLMPHCLPISRRMSLQWQLHGI